MSNLEYVLNIHNCNNINEGQIHVEANKLNIKYGINGTGKSTISQAIECYCNHSEILSLKPYTSEVNPEIQIEPAFNRVMVFNEDFVNNVVFQENEVINNSFDVFLKSANYDRKKQDIEDRLVNLHELIADDGEIAQLYTVLRAVSEKLQFNNDDTIRRTNTYKCLLNKKGLFNVPPQLTSYKEFIEDEENNINWIDWVNKGRIYDVRTKCPYCAGLLKPSHDEEKRVFQETYQRADSMNLKAILDLFELLGPYISTEQFKILVGCIKRNMSAEETELILSKVLLEVNTIKEKIENIKDFGRKNLIISEIRTLSEDIGHLKFEENIYVYFSSVKMLEIFNEINSQIETLIDEIESIKREIGSLKAVLKGSVFNREQDINLFLKIAGLKYEINIITEDEKNSRTILKECFNHTEVDSIRRHLSWGEKNVFSLILFMYYAVASNADLIILDDPVSSFDNNKKYAIFYRLFKSGINNAPSLNGKTVLLFTHDFEPIIDLCVNRKLNYNAISPYYIYNDNGNLKEERINVAEDVLLISNQLEEIAQDVDINIVSRIAALRRFSEFKNSEEDWHLEYKILSSLIHGRLNPVKRDDNGNYVDLPQEDIDNGVFKIRMYIHDFDYVLLRERIFNPNDIQPLIQLYDNENNNYFKIQIFRAMYTLDRSIAGNVNQEGGWLKIIDETYHIENEDLYSLNIKRFNYVPHYLIELMDEKLLRIRSQTR